MHVNKVQMSSILTTEMLCLLCLAVCNNSTQLSMNPQTPVSSVYGCIIPLLSQGWVGPSHSAPRRRFQPRRLRAVKAVWACELWRSPRCPSAPITSPVTRCSFSCYLEQSCWFCPATISGARNLSLGRRLCGECCTLPFGTRLKQRVTWVDGCLLCKGLAACCLDREV